MTGDNNDLPLTRDGIPTTPPPDEVEQPAQPVPEGSNAPGAPQDAALDDLGPRLERLGGEPAPDITPEEFARLQHAGQIHIDPRGRVRTTQRDETDAGISLRKRRAWYAPV
ncbi:MAG TPA: hypothetical protein VMT24_06980 [Aggregatilineaceae bacterium]|nr:hypothetical protein [Aggregatilineaceae bacterium]